MKLDAKQLRSFNRRSSFAKQINEKRITRNAIYIVLDNVLDTYNIGSIFRLADAVAAKKIYLCGGTETPPNPRIKKASINTTEWVDWEYCKTAVEAIEKVRSLWNCHPERSEGSSATMEDLSRAKSIDSSLIARNDRREIVVAIEQTAKSVPYNTFEYKLPICLVVGHESNGVSREVLDMVDGIVEIPMFGANKSLNVMVSLGIVLYEVIEKAS